MRRRDFFSVMGGGIVVLLAVDESEAQEARRGRGGFNGDAFPKELSAWLHIGEDGTVTICSGKAEMGQNVRTSITQAVAEELRTPVKTVQTIVGDTDLTPFDAGTFGSRSTPTMIPQIRKVAATAREMLLDVAAQTWNVDRASLRAADGHISGSGKSASYGELTRGRKLTETVRTDVALTPAAEWKLSGTSVPKVTGRALVTGAHKFPYDIARPGMMHGKTLRPPAFGATLVSLDTKDAEAIPGVKVVREGDFVGVAAPDPVSAGKAVAALKAEWKTTPQVSAADLFAHLRKTADASNVPAPQQVYTVPYIAHTPLEPRAAVAEWNGGKVTVWTGSQRPFGVKQELVSEFQLPPDKVRVIIPDTGSGYGGKHTGDAALEAARLAKAAGKPVKVNWTRQEEFTWAYFRPAGVIEVSGDIGPDGRITRWEFHNFNSGAAGIQTPYHIPGARCEYHPSKTPLRQGSYRALAATANHFARESFMDELAERAKLDPLEFRLRNATDERLRAVIQAAAERFGWASRKKAAGRGFGMAAGFEKGGYVATCAEIAVDPRSKVVKVLRVTEAFECGAVVNPEELRNQIEGAIVMGLGGALMEAIDFENGKIITDRLARYRVPRFQDVPVIETVMVNRKDLPSAGAGETPIVGIAPAVGNAIRDATGQRLRALPLRQA